jgi:hypothetical protein
MIQADTSTQAPVVQTGTLLNLKAGIWVKGAVVLTTERFTRQVRGTAILYNYFGFLGDMLNNLFPPKTDIDILLASITVIGRGKIGLKKDVLYIETADGKSYNLMPNYQAWLAKLKGALESQGATLAQSGDERWSVQH